MIAVLPAPAGATDAEWTGPPTGNQTWFASTPGANWSTAIEPDAPGDSAWFAGLNVSEDLTVDLEVSDLTLGSLGFSGPAYSAGFRLTGSGALLFDSNSDGFALLASSLAEADRDRPAPSGIYIQTDLLFESKLEIRQFNDHANRFLQIDGSVEGQDLSTGNLTISGVSTSDVRFDIDRTTVRANSALIDVVDLVVAGSELRLTYDGAWVFADVTVEDGTFAVADGKTTRLWGDLAAEGGRVVIGSGATLETEVGSLSFRGAEFRHSGSIVWFATDTGVISAAEGSFLSFTNADAAALAKVSNISVDGTSSLSGTTAFLTGRTIGTDLDLDPGAMICHRVFDPAGASSPGNLAATPTYLYGTSVDIEGRKGIAGMDRSIPGGYTPWNLHVGSEANTPWLGIGADTGSAQGQPSAIQFGLPADVNGNDEDVVTVSGDFEIRNTSHLVRNSHYHTVQQGVLEVGAKLTGNTGEGDKYDLRITGPGLTAMANANSDVEGTWRVSGGALKLYLYGDTIADNAQDCLGHPDNDIELDNATFTGRAAGKSNEADLDPGRTLIIGPRGGTVYLNDNDINWTAFGADKPFNHYAFQTAINADGLYEPTRSNVYQLNPSPYDGKGLQKLNITGDGQLAGTGTLAIEGNGELRVLGSNPGFAGEVEILSGATLFADRADSLGGNGGTPPPIRVGEGGVFATGYAPTAAGIARVSGAGVYGVGGSYAGNIDLSSSSLWLHTIKPGIETVTLSDVTPNAALGYRFGGAGGVLFVTQSLSGQNVTVQGPGITILSADNSGIGSLDFSRGGLGIGHVNAIGSGVTVDVGPGESLLFANGLHAASPGRGYTINQAGGSVGFVGDFTLTDLGQLGAMTATSGTQVLGIGAPGDFGTIAAAGVAIATSPSGRPIRLEKYGDSVLDLRGGAGNPYTGSTFIYGGGVRVDNGAQLGTSEMSLYSGGTLEFWATTTWQPSSVAKPLRFGAGGWAQPIGTEAAIWVAEGEVATIDAVTWTRQPGGRLRKTGPGTLELTGMFDFKFASHAWGLTLEDGLATISELPYDTAETNGSAVFRGGDLRCLASTGDDRNDHNYGFWGFILEEDVTSTVYVDNNGLFKLTGTLNNPRNRFDGTLVVAGADETSLDANDWGEVLFSYVLPGGGAGGGVGFADDSAGTLEIRSGLLTTESSIKPRMPKNPEFTLKLYGGKVNAGGNEAWLNGHLVIDDGDNGTPVPQVAELDVASAGDTTWQGSLRKVGNGTLNLRRTTGSATSVAPGSMLTVEGGTVRISGSVDPLSDGAETVDVTVLGGTVQFAFASPYAYTGSLVNDGLVLVSSEQVTLPNVLTSPAGTGSIEVSANASLESDGFTNAASVTVRAGASLLCGVADCDTDALSIHPDGRLWLAGNALRVGREGLTEGELLQVEIDLNEAVRPQTSEGDASVLDSGLDALHLLGVKSYDNYVEVRLTLAGDADLDDDVDGDDMAILSANFGTNGSGLWSLGDSNHDTAVDHLDYLIVKANLGQSVDGQTSIPEPNTLVLLAGMSSLLLQRRRRSA